MNYIYTWQLQGTCSTQPISPTFNTHHAHKYTNKPHPLVSPQRGPVGNSVLAQGTA